MGQRSPAGHFGQQEGDQSKESYCQAKAPDVSSQSAITREKELLRAQHLPTLTPWSYCREPSASRLSPRLHRINPLGSLAERCCVHAICGVTRGVPDVRLQPHRVASRCLPFLRAPQGNGFPSGTSLLALMEVTAGTALRSATWQGKQQAAKYIPVLLLAPCRQPRHVRGSGGHGLSAATSLLPAGPPQDVSHCSLSLSFLAERTHTDSAPGLRQHSHYHGSVEQRECHPRLPRPHAAATTTTLPLSSPCHGGAG